jgi:hypothetical protein
MAPSQHADVDVLLSASIVTGRYQTWKPAHGVPIRTTIGEPKFWGRRRKLEDLRVAAPWGLMDADDWRERYEQRLDAEGDRIIRQLARIARQCPGEQLALLCFENVNAGEECHRRTLAEWLEDRLDIRVPEMAADDQLPGWEW